MIWIDSISQLDYYNNAPGAPCYCDQLVYPSDLILQAQYTNTTPSPTVTISVLSADGLTVYEDATAYFEYYFFTVNGIRYCNIRLNSYSPAMCTYKCWILQVQIGTNPNILFNKYTQRYCQTTCCDVPRGITITSDTVGVSALQAAIVQQAAVPTTDCGSPLIRIEVEFPCLDAQLSDYYDIPAGQTWGFKKITNISGKVRRRPREITRNVSYNCNLQRSESFIPYRVYSQGDTGTFPAWKMGELESMFHAPRVGVTDFIDEYLFQFDGGAICKPIADSVCWDVFQLDTTLRTCTIRQTFGCDTSCDNPNKSLVFLIPESYGGGNFYNENRVNLGGYPALLAWYGAQSLISEVADVTSDYDNVYAAFRVTGMGYIPTQFYFGQPTPQNRVYGVNSPSSPDAGCAMPVVGEIIVIPAVCAVPTIGTIIVIPEETETAAVNDYGNWDVDQLVSDVALTGTYARLDLTTFNPLIITGDDFVTRYYEVIAPAAGSSFDVPEGDAMVVNYGGQSYIRTTDFTQTGLTVTMLTVTFAEGDAIEVGVNVASENIVQLVNEPIGVISQPGRPAFPQTINIGDAVMTIDANGVIYWTGEPTTVDGTGSEIVANGIYYNLISQ